MYSQLSPTDRLAFKQGMRDYSVAFVALLAWGLVTGIAMSKSTLTPAQAVGMTVLVYAGSSQLAVLPLFATHMPIWSILLTAAMVNTRFVIFSAGLAPHFAYLPLWRRVLLGFFNGDVIYLLFVKQGFAPGRVPGKEAYFWGMSLLSWAGWQASSLVGIGLAHMIPDSWGLDLAGTLALLPILVSAIVNRATLVAVTVAGVVALLATRLPYELGLPIAVLMALASGSLADFLVERSIARRESAREPLRDLAGMAEEDL